MNIFSCLVTTFLASVLATPVFANTSNLITYRTPVEQVVSSTNLLNKGTLSNVNINTADAETLTQELVGIGPKRAEMIVAYREKYGPFKSIDDLLKVEGIGKKTLDKNRDKITI